MVLLGVYFYLCFCVCNFFFVHFKGFCILIPILYLLYLFVPLIPFLYLLPCCGFFVYCAFLYPFRTLCVLLFSSFSPFLHLHYLCIFAPSAVLPLLYPCVHFFVPSCTFWCIFVHFFNGFYLYLVPCCVCFVPCFTYLYPFRTFFCVFCTLVYFCVPCFLTPAERILGQERVRVRVRLRRVPAPWGGGLHLRRGDRAYRKS